MSGRTGTCLGILLIFGLSGPAVGQTCEATLAVDDVVCAPGRLCTLPVSLTNNEVVRGVDVELHENPGAPDLLLPLNCVSLVPRFGCEFQDSARGDFTTILLVSLEGAEIPPGNNQPLVEVTYTVAPQASGAVIVTPQNLTVADQNNRPCDTTSLPGTVTFELPTLSVNDVTRVEGDVGTTSFDFTIRLSAARNEVVTVDYATANGTATSPGDYQAVAGTETFNPGETSKLVRVLVNGDTLIEDDETFFVELSGPTNATIDDGQGRGTIQDDEEPPTISIDDVSRIEGDAGATSFDFTVGLSEPSDQTVSVDYATADGTATSPDDYRSVGLTRLTFNPGETSKAIRIEVNGDRVDESDETFVVELSGPVNATIADGQGQGTIQDDDDEPTISIDDVSQGEGDAGTTDFDFTVSLSNPSSLPVTVSYATADGTATSPEDYQAVPPTPLTFDPGETSQIVSIQVNGDILDESDETFFVELSGPANATIEDGQGQGTIRDDEDTPAISIDDVSRIEGDAGTTRFDFTVSLSAASLQPVTVDYATTDGTARSPEDYQSVAPTSLTFDPGETERTVSVQVNGDTLVESDETFFVDLSGPTNATIADARGQGTILDDDVNVAPVLDPIGDRTVSEGAQLTIVLSATDANTADTLTFSASNLPGFCRLAGFGDPDWRLQCSPESGNAGTYLITVTVTDSANPPLSDSETFTLTVVSTAGVDAVDDAAGTRAGEPVTIDLLANDEGQGLSVTDVSAPLNGVVVDNGNGTVTYTPNLGFSGVDTFTYAVVDTDGNADSATVRVSVGVAGIEDLDDNQQSVAEALDRVCNEATGELGAVCEELQQELSDEEARGALDQIAPEKISAQGTSVVEAAGAQLGNVRNRLTTLRLGAAGSGLSGLSVNVGGKNLPLGSIILALSERGRPNAKDGDSIAEEGKLGFFINGRADFGEKDSTTNETGFDFDSQGLTVGLDYRFSPRFVFGGALGYGEGDSDFAGSGGDLESSSVQLSAYGIWYPSDRSYIDWIVGFGSNDFDMTRNIVFPGVNTFTEGSTDGDQQSISISGGWDFNKNAWSYASYLRLEFITVDIDGYTETGGSGLALIVDEQSIDSLSTALAGRAGRTISTSWGVFAVGLRVEWEHEYDDDNRLVATRFAEDPSGVFTIATDDPDRNFFNLGLNFAATLKGGKALFFDYERVVGLDDVTRNTVNLGFRKEF